MISITPSHMRRVVYLMFLSFDAPMAFNSLTIFSPKATMLFAASPE